jgi:protein disulfide-isomerase A1
MALRFLALLLLACSSLEVSADDDGEVIELTAANFDETIAKYDQLLIEFYAPWCGFCQAMDPIYKDAALMMKEKGMKSRLAKIDATVEEHKPIKEDFQVSGFPQIFLVQAGVRVFVRTEQFLDAGSDAKGVENMVKYLQDKEPFTDPSEKNPLWPVISTEDDAFGDKLKNGTKAVIIGFFFPDFDSKEAQKFKGFAIDSADVDKYQHFMSRDKTLMAKYGVEPPGIVLIHADDRSDFATFDPENWDKGPYELASFHFTSALPKVLIYDTDLVSTRVPE